MKLNRENLWITSDTHYAHKNICRGVSEWDWKSKPNSVRNFETLSQMNDTIVNNINDVVEYDHTLIHVGDWSFGGFDKIPEFRSRVVCQNIIFIPGNHDHHIKKNKNNVRELFSYIIKLEEIEIDKKKFVFCHFPQKGGWVDMSKGSYMIHGHTHSKGEDRFSDMGRMMDVGMDGHPEFRPYHIEEIFELLKYRVNVQDNRHG
jgi:calcineurin-like phosphoesterase family protein